MTSSRHIPRPGQIARPGESIGCLEDVDINNPAYQSAADRLGPDADYLDVIDLMFEIEDADQARTSAPTD